MLPILNLKQFPCKASRLFDAGFAAVLELGAGGFEVDEGLGVGGEGG